MKSWTGAREHVDAFALAHNAYFEPRPFDVRKVWDADRHRYEFVPMLHRSPPLRLGVILGDMVHNLRSALDHLVWQAVLRNGGRPNRSHQFPICDDEKDWNDACNRVLRGLDAVDAEAVRDAQPFNVVMKPAALSRLREISNEDKHRVVTPVWRRSARPTR
jgi:hypothetical protein